MINSNIVKNLVIDFARTASRNSGKQISTIEISDIVVKSQKNFITFVAKTKDGNALFYRATILSGNLEQLKSDVPVYTLSVINCMDVKSSNQRILAYVA
ncbi:MAG: hypothetical protein RR144_05480 [Clostridia bacterium]